MRSATGGLSISSTTSRRGGSSGGTTSARGGGVEPQAKTNRHERERQRMRASTSGFARASSGNTNLIGSNLVVCAGGLVSIFSRLFKGGPGEKGPDDPDD